MAIIFLLGPSVWKSKKISPIYSPMQKRRQLAEIFRADNHKIVIMEDEPDIKDEHLYKKFYRLINDKKVTDIIMYWPSLAEMQTTQIELVLLGIQNDTLPTPQIWLFHHTSVFSDKMGEGIISDGEDRSSYLSSILNKRKKKRDVEFENDEDLTRKAEFLSKELQIKPTIQDLL